MLELLLQNYIVPVLGYRPDMLCRKTHRVLNGVPEHTTGFVSNWKAVPKSPDTLCNRFVKEWLNIRESSGEEFILDDLVQIGCVDWRILGDARNVDTRNRLQLLEMQSKATSPA